MITENLWTVSRHVSTKSWPRHSTARDTQKIARYVYMHISCIYIYTKPERYLFNKRPHDFGGIHLSVVHVHPLPSKIISTKKLPLPKKTTSQNPPLPKKQKQIKKNKIPKSLGQKIPSQKKSVGPKNPFPKSKKKNVSWAIQETLMTGVSTSLSVGSAVLTAVFFRWETTPSSTIPTCCKLQPNLLVTRKTWHILGPLLKVKLLVGYM